MTVNRIRLLLLIGLVGVAFAARLAVAEAPDPAQRTPNPAPNCEPATRFETVEVFIDSKDQPLAAYQFEFKSFAADVTVVGIEGGDPAAFKTPPYYDPEALSQGRLIVAGFNTGADLPKGKNRIATLHIQVKGNAVPVYEASLTVSATTGGKPVPAAIFTARGAK